MKFRSLLLSMLFLVAGTTASAACKKPTIRDPRATPDSSGQQETITWTTDVAADSLVGYGRPNAGTLTAITDLTGVMSHSVTITGLIPTGVYNWAIRSRAIDGGRVCSESYYTFYNGPGGTYFTTAAPPDGPFDYVILPVGGHHVTQGYGMYYAIQIATLAGTYPSKGLRLLLTGLPPFTTVRWTDAQIIGDDPDVVSTTTVPYDTVLLYDLGPGPVLGAKEPYILTDVGGTTPPGNYTITMTMSGSDLPTHSATWGLTVDPASAPFSGVAFPSGTPSSYPAIPNLSTYVSSASTYGISNCAQDTNTTRTIRPNDPTKLTPVGPSTTYDSWFYDGVMVYYNVQSLVNDGDNWAQCRENVAQVYRDNYALKQKIFELMMFTEGYYLDYSSDSNTGTDADLQLINQLDGEMYAPYHAVMVDVTYLQRETAYALKNAIYASALQQNNSRFNNTTAFWRDYALDHVLGHVDQICLSQNAQYFESFMTGLEAEALIQYYDVVGHDPRIPPAVKCLADYMYSSVYNTVTSDPGSFPYDKWRMLTNAGVGNNGGSCMINMNMLIVPMFAWVFKNTGLSAYQAEGDEIWNHGVLFDGCQGGLAANLTGPSGNSGKQFSQQYYWGPSYVAWRSGIETTEKTGQLGQPGRPTSPTGLSAIVH
jgi:hypothetical protein